MISVNGVSARDPYPASAAAYKLLAAYSIAENPLYPRVLAETLSGPHALDVFGFLVGFAYRAVVSLHNGDEQAARHALTDELVTAKRLAVLRPDDFGPGPDAEDYRRSHGEPLR